jgi:hypothetical protein
MPHTPGPWYYGESDDGEIFIWDAHDLHFIGSAGGEDVSQTVKVANARLMAASPTLLAACKAAYSLIGPQHAGQVLEVMMQLHAVIAAAEGQS